MQEDLGERVGLVPDVRQKVLRCECHERCAGRGNDGSKAHIPGQREHQCKNGNEHTEDTPVQHQEYRYAHQHALAALEAVVQREYVPDDGEDAGNAADKIEIGAALCDKSCQHLADEDGDHALGQIADEGKERTELAETPQGIGQAGVAAAEPAHILMLQEANRDDGRIDAAHQVADGSGDDTA